MLTILRALLEAIYGGCFGAWASFLFIARDGPAALCLLRFPLAVAAANN